MAKKEPKKGPKKEKPDDLAKLLRLTQLIKKDKVEVSKQGEPQRSTNKWRSAEPKFAPKENTKKPEGLIEAGGMEVDPARQQEYENWRQDKLDREKSGGSLIRRADPPNPPQE